MSDNSLPNLSQETFLSSLFKVAVSSTHNYLNNYNPNYQKINKIFNADKTPTVVPENIDCKNDEPVKENDDDRLICQICFGNLRKVVYLPCKHILTCNSCSLKIENKKCPYCSTEIKEMYNILFP